MSVSTNALIGGFCAAIIVVAARSRGSLSTNGAIAALVLGIICSAAGWGWAALLIFFFISGTLLSHYKSKRKAERIGSIVEKGGNRDAGQVFANGGIFSLAALASSSSSPMWLCVGAGAIAAATSDTWATEIGVLSNRRPRSILTGRVMLAGESGGITLPGTLAGIFGALATALVVFAFHWGAPAVAAAILGGIGGCIFDSVLGATLQTRRWCERCESNTERSIHDCGTTTIVATGLPWMDNDVVNALCTLAGALIGYLSCLAFQLT